MLASQEIYGPHDVRLWSDGPLAMGRRLFHSLPEDTHDHQPLRSTDGDLVLVADVRLDNRDELIAALGAPTERAHQLCDAAILLASLQRWADRALDRLVGDFAFALWDSRAETLTLARDFLGQRPLHYHRGKSFFAFASMPKGLHALAEIPHAPDDQAMAEFITLMPLSGPRSFFKDIDQVEAGHLVKVTRGGLSLRRYWDPRRPGPTRISSSDYIEGLRHHLDQATRSRLRGANGTVGAQLSAGLDSSSVTATAARLLAPSGGKVIAFTAVPCAGYDGPSPKNSLGDEGPLAATTAAMYPNVEHVLVRTSHSSPLDGLDRTFLLFDRPMLNLCNWVWARAINHAARERNLSILLSGQMGNVSASYTGIELLPELLRAGRIIKLLREAAKLVAVRQMHWRGVLAQTFGPFTPVWLWNWANMTLPGRGSDMFKHTAIRAERLAELNRHALAGQRPVDLLHRPWKDGFAARMWGMSRVEVGNFNKGVLAGWGIDQRDPTADKRLVEYCLSVPTEQYCSKGVTRALAKGAFADRLPQAVLGERKKGYQAVDWHEGLTAGRGSIAAELDRLAPCAPAANVLDIERLRELVQNWPTSGWERDDVIQSYRLALLRGISAGHFLRMAAGENP